MSGSDWTTVRLPAGLKDEIEKLIQRNPQLGYPSYASFVADAVRRRLEELKKAIRDDEERVPL